jgi:hypothetical protein
MTRQEAEATAAKYGYAMQQRLHELIKEGLDPEEALSELDVL